MNDELLRIDLGLLILRYGRVKVLEALAHIENVTVAELEQRLTAAAKKRKTTKTVRPSIMEIVETEASQREEIAEPLRALAVDFQNRTFLPHLRDVHRFLARMNVSHRKFKSRISAGPALIRTLTKLSREDLVRLAGRGSSEERESDYSLLARAIMRDEPKPRGDEAARPKPLKP
jgi:hypothetical protein